LLTLSRLSSSTKLPGSGSSSLLKSPLPVRKSSYILLMLRPTHAVPVGGQGQGIPVVHGDLLSLYDVTQSCNTTDQSKLKSFFQARTLGGNMCQTLRLVGSCGKPCDQELHNSWRCLSSQEACRDLWLSQEESCTHQEIYCHPFLKQPSQPTHCKKLSLCRPQYPFWQTNPPRHPECHLTQPKTNDMTLGSLSSLQTITPKVFPRYQM